ncbi:MAG: tRNA (N6-isopentenyl adenosine(37)-C2)-methylthiotransferase MiaB [Bacteroidetes bacterium]|nr:MAG: tRNA (N6-isopentenyl adenosine(37)-C2)-methylthiotransferase MiaB [Bacteroidota bacterium]
MQELKENNQGQSHSLLSEDRQGEVIVKEGLRGIQPNGKRFYIESYGCQMNFSDSEIVASILCENGYVSTPDYNEADLVLVNTCSIRENAEQRVRNRLKNFHVIKRRNPNALIGVLGCMAERLKEKFLEEEQLVDIVVGPDAYRHLPKLISEAESGQKAVNVLLSREETYADISPVRLSSNGVSAFISIMRGCDNMCSFCVVPFTRGRERSRDPKSIVAEAQDLFDKGYREVTLLGQNVDSYRWSEDPTVRGKKLIELKDTDDVFNFANLLEAVAQVSPQLRVRFSTSHPKDMLDDVLHVMAKYDNICEYIHLPVQSGNSEVLERMNRTYDRAWYMNRIQAIRRILPNTAISTDIIAGFCGETEEQHKETLSIMEEVKYEMAYMFFYSERPGTLAAKRYEDDIPEEVKKRRLREIIDLQREHSLERNKADLGKTFEVLVEKPSKRSEDDLCGRNSQNKMIVFPKGNARIGEYIQVKVTDYSQAILKGEIVA